MEICRGKVNYLNPNIGDNKPDYNIISKKQYEAIVDENSIFKNMAVDLVLNSVGMSNN